MAKDNCILVSRFQFSLKSTENNNEFLYKSAHGLDLNYVLLFEHSLWCQPKLHRFDVLKDRLKYQIFNWTNNSRKFKHIHTWVAMTRSLFKLWICTYDWPDISFMPYNLMAKESWSNHEICMPYFRIFIVGIIAKCFRANSSCVNSFIFHSFTTIGWKFHRFNELI